MDGKAWEKAQAGVGKDNGVIEAGSARSAEQSGGRAMYGVRGTWGAKCWDTVQGRWGKLFRVWTRDPPRRLPAEDYGGRCDEGELEAGIRSFAGVCLLNVHLSSRTQSAYLYKERLVAQTERHL